MVYHQLEEIRDRKGEKIFLFLTLENMVGVGLGAIAGLIGGNVLTGSMIVGGLLALLLATVGMVITMEHQGLAGYERLGWRMQGILRRMTRGTSLSPEQLAGARATTRRDRPLQVGGAVRVVRKETHPVRTVGSVGPLPPSTPTPARDDLTRTEPDDDLTRTEPDDDLTRTEPDDDLTRTEPDDDLHEKEDLHGYPSVEQPAH
jgi:hypothetical protein